MQPCVPRKLGTEYIRVLPPHLGCARFPIPLFVPPYYCSVMFPFLPSLLSIEQLEFRLSCFT